MFNASFMASIMNMRADVYTQQNSQDPSTGAIIRAWTFSHTIQCKVEPIKVSGASTRTDNAVYATNAEGVYSEKQQLKFKGLELLSKRSRIQNIRSSDNKKVFIEIDKAGQPDTMFEVTSSHAVLDPFGKIAYYEAMLLRAQVQDDASTGS
jgi:hypothetical protein